MYCNSSVLRPAGIAEESSGKLRRLCGEAIGKLHLRSSSEISQLLSPSGAPNGQVTGLRSALRSLVKDQGQILAKCVDSVDSDSGGPCGADVTVIVRGKIQFHFPLSPKSIGPVEKLSPPDDFCSQPTLRSALHSPILRFAFHKTTMRWSAKRSSIYDQEPGPLICAPRLDVSTQAAATQ